MQGKVHLVLRLATLISFAGALACGGQAPSDAARALASAPPVLSWQTGMRATGDGATIEPAVSDTDGSQTFLVTPNGSPFYDGSATPDAPPPPAFTISAPLYLVTYPLDSTVDTTPGAPPLNCYTEGFFTPGLPYNCDHAQIPGIKGHDHLVGVPASGKAGGDYDVPWHVFAAFFTPQGVSDGAMNTRILTLDQLTAAQTSGDVTPFVDTHIYFECAVVSGAVYQNSTPLSF
jgi:hypothetical protein